MGSKECHKEKAVRRDCLISEGRLDPWEERSMRTDIGTTLPRRSFVGPFSDFSNSSD